MYHAYECGAWYATSYMEGDTSEWCVKTNKKGRITSVSIGGQNCHVLYGPAFFSKEFSEQFLPIINVVKEIIATAPIYNIFRFIIQTSFYKSFTFPTTSQSVKA